MAITIDSGHLPESSAASSRVARSVQAGKTLAEVRSAEIMYLAERRRLTERQLLAGVGDPARGTVAVSTVGLALSGGGIRSATTNLGMLQALARMRLLPYVDYLCTVSGGGYIGACLSALLSVNDDPERTPGDGSQYEFDATRGPLYTTDRDRFPFRDVPGPWPPRPVPAGTPTSGRQEVKHLRTHGSFLVVRKGLFTTETLRSVGVLLSGVVFHWLLYLLTTAGLAALCLAWTVGLLAPEAPRRIAQATIVAAPVGAKPEAPPSVWKRMKPKVGLFWDATAAAVDNARQEPMGPFRRAAGFGVLVACLTFFVTAVAARVQIRLPAIEGESEEDTYYRVLLKNIRRLGFLVLIAIVVHVRASADPGVDALAWLLLPLAVGLGFWATAFTLYVLLPWTELWSRAFRAAWASVEALGTYWLVAAVALALFPFATYAISQVGLGAVLAAVAAALASRILAPRTGTRPRVPGWAWPGIKRALLAILVVAFIVLTVLLLAAWFVSWDEATPKAWVPSSLSTLVAEGFTRAPSTIQTLAAAFTHREFLVIALAAIAALCLAGILGNANRLALHYFYRDRLMETYLRTEATRAQDLSLEIVHDAMGVRLKELHGVAPRAGSPDFSACVSTAPYLVISTAINLAERRDLTRKDRKSGYFTFTKLFCGSYHTSFCPTEEYQGGGVNLARAMTISGAAVGSGMGYQTFFAQAFATTLFNLRLGYWMENPGKPLRWFRSWSGRPMFSPWYLLREMCSWTHARGRLVNLSDGGHTGDNVGIYPLLQRRCRVIIACDAEADAELSFGSFTEALRHAYIDMNVEVDIDLTMIRPDPVTKLSRRHCAVGRIKYPPALPGEPPVPARAWLIYIKSSLSGDEPEPVKNYKVDHGDFPHETTADQFFTDAQFESYRALGDHLAEHAFGESFDRGVVFSEEWLGELCALHSSARAAADAAHQRANERLAAVEDALTRDPTLDWYYDQCYGAQAAAPAPPYPLAVRRVFLQQARLMEQMFAVLELARHPNAPDNRAWMRLFRMWARSPVFQTLFDQVRGTLGPDFVAFYDAYVQLRPGAALDDLVPHPWDGALRHGDPRIYLDPGRREAGA
jgi:hypothetical protein